MWWFKKYPELFIKECESLRTNSNYQEVSQTRNNLLVSSGNVIVRLKKNFKYPIAIIYPNTTPFELPIVYLLKETLSEEQTEVVSKMDLDSSLSDFFRPLVKFYYHRHQNFNGTLCLLESDNLDGNGAWFFSIDQVISRIRQWFAGISTNQFPPEGPEVELFLHFPNGNPDLEFLPTEPFYNHSHEEGEFFFCQIGALNFGDYSKDTYLGINVSGTTNGIIIPESEFEIGFNPRLPEWISSPADLLNPNNSGLLKNELDDENIIKGYWWRIEEECRPFESISDLVAIIGFGDKTVGYHRMFQICSKAVGDAENIIFLGITFPNRRQEPEWLFLNLVKREDSNHVPLLSIKENEFIKKLDEYDFVVIRSEKLNDSQFHLRNSSRADRSILKNRGVNLIGCGSLGSEIADCLVKAGLGNLHLIDHDVIRPHNAVRHICGIQNTGFPKVIALKFQLSHANPFTEISIGFDNILRQHLMELLTIKGIGISTIADDNIESYLNEQAVIHNQVIFYARALRGGKAARIFRVIPGQDACFNCLILHRRDKNPKFADLPEDKTLPTLTNECNNPVRPGSAADLKLISSLTSRILLDELQEGHQTNNHWIWSTEKLDGLNPYEFKSTKLGPHSECTYCRQEHPLHVTIKKDALKNMVVETEKDNNIETGGVLLGSFADKKLEISFASGPGPNAIKEEAWFEKDIKYCQNFLDQNFKTSGNKALYLGEWHYHPSKDNSPSNTDISSLSKISFQNDYLTDKPVMIILNNQGHPRTTVHPANMRYYEVEIEEI